MAKKKTSSKAKAVKKTKVQKEITPQLPPVVIQMPESRNAAHPFLVFWIGVLTGALIVALVFSYLFFQTQSIQDVILESSGFQSLIE